MQKLLAGLSLACVVSVSADAATPAFRLPAGFEIEELVADVPNARAMTWGDQGTLFVGTRRAGNVYAVRNALAGEPDVILLVDDLKMPNGVAFRDGALYVAEPQRILRFPNVEDRLEDPGEPEVAVTDLPFKNMRHAWKYIAFGPDGRLYVPVGAPCNVCDDEGFSLILSMQPDGSDRRVEARGVRNSVGFDWHPDTGELWFTDNGRDLMGDEVPPCELNRVTEPGQDFGFPYCHGANIVDPKLGALGNCADATAPAQNLAPHSAPLGLLFYTGAMFPPRYRDQAFIAEHGSWNRTEEAGKTGYRVTLVTISEGKAVSYEPFLEGFLDGQETIGRPVDLLLAPDGSMLISDDKRGAIYRVRYTGPGLAGLRSW
ncbi:MAG: PQQ-dependent sugar dehydrogenase [Gammaproteobacteria bacterium]|nr:PQQ-dependent sugar dehydrogenase [Gammaproteobacteria bacterium]